MTESTIANRYYVVRQLGEGAMGLVWEVRDGLSDEHVALKVISGGLGESDKSVLQFKQEFRLMAQLRHPNCCAVYDFGQMGNGAPFFTMELVPGQGLDECMPLPPNTFRTVLAQLLLALGYIHQRGFVHCDLKGANVRIRSDGSVKLMDFGLMDHAGRSGGPIRGTVPYLAPEMIKRGRIDQRTDLYALGALAFEMLTGRPPFQGATPLEVLRAHTTEQAPPPSRFKAGLEPSVERIVLKLLAKDPVERFASAADVLAALGVEPPAGLGGNLLASPLVGREAEVTWLLGWLERIAKGEAGGLVLLVGAAGMGKSRLIDELRFAAQLASMPFTRGGSPGRSPTPYGPFLPVLRQLVARLQDEARPTFDRLAPVFAKLLPELGVAPAADFESAEKEKLRLHGAVHQMVETLARHRASVIVLEDWQSADPLSVDLLRYLSRNMTGLPLLLLVASREALANVPEGEQRSLAPLLPEDVGRMVASMFGSEDIEPAFIKRVAALSEGNPAVVERLLDELVRGGLVSHAEGRWQTRDMWDDTAPTTLNTLLAKKVMDLQGPARELAEAAAVIGRPARLELLAAVSGLATESLFEGVDVLTVQRIIALDENGRYAITQDALQAMLYQDQAKDTQRDRHQRAAETLSAEFTGVPLHDLPHDAVTALATHYVQAGVTAPAIRHATEAGRRSARLFANDEAIGFLETALSLIDGDPGHDWRRERLECLRNLGNVGRVTGRLMQTEAAYLEAIALAEALGEPALAGRLHGSLAKTLQLADRLPEAMHRAERAFEQCQAAGYLAGAARSRLITCRIHFFRGAIPEALAHAEEGLALARACGDRIYEAEAGAFIGYMYVIARPEQVRTGIQHLEEAIALLQAMGDMASLENAYDLLGNAHHALGNLQEAREAFVAGSRIATALGIRSQLAFSLINQALVAMETGDFNETRALCEAARAGATGKLQLGLCWLLEALAEAHQGRFASAEALLTEAEVQAADLGDAYLQTYAAQYRVEYLLLRGEPESALSAGQALKSRLETANNPTVAERLRLLLAEAHTRLGAFEAARALADEALAAATTIEARLSLMHAHRVLAALHLGAERWPEARAACDEAIAIATDIGAAYWMGDLHGMAGEIALKTQSGLASDHFTTMRSLATATAAPLLTAQALFGLAACAPYGAEAKTLKEQAASVLEALEGSAGAAWRDDPRIKRVLEGNHVGFSLPATRAASEPAPLNPQGMRGGLWNMM